jgi:hypothetical protein
MFGILAPRKESPRLKFAALSDQEFVSLILTPFSVSAGLKTAPSSTLSEDRWPEEDLLSKYPLLSCAFPLL